MWRIDLSLLRGRTNPAVRQRKPCRGRGRLASVPRYFFHLFNDETCHDEEGVELPNDAAAVHHAARSARELAAETVRQGHLILDHRIEITDAGGSSIGKVRFGDVVEVRVERNGSATVSDRAALA